MAKRFLEANKRGKIEITGFRPLDKFYLLNGKDYLLLKKVEEPALAKRFDKLTEEIETKFKTEYIKKSDIQKAIKWSRSK